MKLQILTHKNHTQKKYVILFLFRTTISPKSAFDMKFRELEFQVLNFEFEFTSVFMKRKTNLAYLEGAQNKVY